MEEGNLKPDVSNKSSEEQKEKSMEEQLKDKSKPKENFLSRMINIWKRIMFDPEDFLENPPEIGWMLAFVAINFAILMFSMFLTSWIVISSASQVFKIPSISFGSIFVNFIRALIIGGIIAGVCLFIIAGLTFLMTKIFGSKNNNFVSVFDIVSAPYTIGVLSPIIIIFFLIARDITSYYVNLILLVALVAIISIFFIYLIYVIIAGLKKVCQISGLKASASWIIAIVIFIVALILIFQPTMPWDESYYSPYSNPYNKKYYDIKGQKDYEDLLKEFDKNDYDYDYDYDY